MKKISKIVIKKSPNNVDLYVQAEAGEAYGVYKVLAEHYDDVEIYNDFTVDDEVYRMITLRKW
jgi:hypothetical protein